MKYSFVNNLTISHLIMKRIALLILILHSSFFTLHAQNVTRILSPDGMTYVDVRIGDGRASYSAGYRRVVKKNTVDVQNAYDDNYTDYRDTIPHLFHYNALCFV